MSGSAEDRDALAAEYVLGTLSAQEAEAVARRLPTDPALAEAVAAWERRLAPLTRLALPEAPPPDLWAGIEARIGGVAPARAVRRTPLVRWWAAGASVAAAAMAGLLLVQLPRTAPQLATAMVGDRSQPAWTAWADADGTLHLAAAMPVAGSPPPLPTDRVLQLWALPPGAAAPTSLAILAPGQTSLVLPSPAIRLAPGVLIELTLEPLGGSPLPRPSGPVQFIGRLARST